MIVVVTSINTPDNRMHFYRESGVADSVLWIGDRKSEHFESSSVNYFSLQKQEKLGFKVADLLPVDHYCRKNIGYLLAYQDGAHSMLDTDDDNFPYTNYVEFPNLGVVRGIRSLKGRGRVNIYRYFTEDDVQV